MKPTPERERANTTAQMLNGISVSLISFGIIVPLLTKLPFAVSLIISVLGAGSLHVLARRLIDQQLPAPSPS